MTAGAPGHRRVVQLTGRDGDALRWVGEMFAARTDTLAVVLGRLSPRVVPEGFVTDRVVRRVMGRWERAGLVRSVSMLGRMWAVPTERGLAYAGLVNGERPWAEWQPSKPRLGHVHACGLVRLAVEAAEPEATWTAERFLRRLPDADAFHLADAELVWPGGAHWSVEVELTQKSDDNFRPTLTRLRPGLARVQVLTWPAMVGRLRGQVERVSTELAGRGWRLEEPAAGKGALPAVRVELLPEVPGATYEGRW